LTTSTLGSAIARITVPDLPTGSRPIRAIAPSGELRTRFEVTGAASVAEEEEPTAAPSGTATPTETATETATAEPTGTAEPSPTAAPTEEPTAEPTAEPTEKPTTEPTATPTEELAAEPTEEPTQEPTEEPTAEPTATPTEPPTAEPTATPTPEADADEEADAAATADDAPPATAEVQPYRVRRTIQSRDAASGRVLLDGDPATVWWAGGGSSGESAVTFDLGGVNPIGRIRWLVGADGLAGALRIEVSTNRRRWTAVAEPGGGEPRAWQEVAFAEPVPARYVRFVVAGTEETEQIGGLAELEIWP
jgi:hypothetical protein